MKKLEKEVKKKFREKKLGRDENHLREKRQEMTFLKNIIKLEVNVIKNLERESQGECKNQREIKIKMKNIMKKNNEIGGESFLL